VFDPKDFERCSYSSSLWSSIITSRHNIQTSLITMVLSPLSTSSLLVASSTTTTTSMWMLDNDFHHRLLQFEIPDYTSPPLDDALAATPEAYRDDTVIDMMRDMDAAGNCTAMSCFILFDTAMNSTTTTSTTTGVLLYGGGLVDPRAYSVLAEPLAAEGYTVLIPVFANDVAFGIPCGTGRLEFAQEVYPNIDSWILAGHSLGGVAAMSDAWLALEEGDPTVAGVVLMAADVQPFVCGSEDVIDFSAIDLPMATLTATEDGILNFTRWNESIAFLSNDTIFVSIEGGNHGQFGDYNDTLRTTILGQMDGEATISPQEQWQMSVDTILEVIMLAADSTQSPSISPTTSETDPPIASESSHIVTDSWTICGLVVVLAPIMGMLTL
jgi:hypothetical protein